MHFNQIISTGIYKNIDFVIWIDGYNELIMSRPSKFYFGFNLPFNIFPVRIFSEDLRDMPTSYINPDDLCNGYLLYRKNIVNILESLGIKSINILQPGLREHTKTSERLSVHFTENQHLETYLRIVSRLMSSDAARDLGFHFFDQKRISYEFWDRIHLSPKGEKEFADDLYQYLIGLLV